MVRHSSNHCLTGLNHVLTAKTPKTWLSLPSLLSYAVNTSQEQCLRQCLEKEMPLLGPAGTWQLLCQPGRSSSSSSKVEALSQPRRFILLPFTPRLWKAPDHHRQLCCLPDLTWSFTEGFWFSLSLCLYQNLAKTQKGFTWESCTQPSPGHLPST